MRSALGLFVARNTASKKFPDVSLGGRRREDALPMPWVEYPTLYGAFFRYSEEECGPYVFCGCSLPALENLCRLNAKFSVQKNANPARMAPLDSFFVPESAALESVGLVPESVRDLRLVEGVCHRCNQVPPQLRWCHEMYGDEWKQAYGWFPLQFALEGGVHPVHLERHLEDRIPQEIREDVEEYTAVFNEIVANSPFDPTSAIAKDVARLRKKARTSKTRIMRYFTSEAREAFGFKRVGEGWLTETMLFKSVQALLPDTRLIRHFRGDWLEGLELDIYAPCLGVGIEYQGEQHSGPVGHWGGKATFERQKARDERKRRLCEKHGCKLIEVWHGTDVSVKNVRKILTESGIEVP